jgi:hypothetical protein
MLTVVHDPGSSNEDAGASRSLLDEIVRDGARQMLAAVLAAEVAAYVDQLSDQVDERGWRLGARNGHHHQRDVLTAAGAVSVRAPRVNDRRVDPDTHERQRFSSAILPAWARKSSQMTEVLPLLYLHGLSSGDFGPAPEQSLGSGAGLSATTIIRLTWRWQDEAKTFQDRDLSGTDYVYLWVDGIHLKVRLEQEKLCLLVMIGVRSDGRKELVAPTCSWSSTSTRRALGAPAHHEPDRIDVCDRVVADQGGQGTRIPRSRNCHGLQAHRRRTSALACTTPGRPRPCRRGVPQRQAARTPGRHHTRRDRRINRNGGRLKQPHPQVLTISPVNFRALQQASNNRSEHA